jgi:hypothetical protein
MALAIWAILTAAAPDAEARESLLVYGDDVIVPTAYAADAIEQLESFGLKVNRDKSCTNGFFRESCGMDAYKGVDVTPLKLKTVWSSARSSSSYVAWIAYANQYHHRKCYMTYKYVVGLLTGLYQSIPGVELCLTAPSLVDAPDGSRPIRKRWNKFFQREEFHVWTPRAPIVTHKMDGWRMMARTFAERHVRSRASAIDPHSSHDYSCPLKWSASEYTLRDTSVLVKQWMPKVWVSNPSNLASTKLKQCEHEYEFLYMNRGAVNSHGKIHHKNWMEFVRLLAQRAREIAPARTSLDDPVKDHRVVSAILSNEFSDCAGELSLLVH